jgi:hypothetical protein
MTVKNAVRVAVPVKLARLSVWVDKGRHWSGVDRLVLWALAVQPRTAGELAVVARIPARLITEIVLRMMRFGWIEFAAAPKGAAFRATEAGREVVETFETLPPVTRRTPRRISFAMEPFAWRAYGLRDLKPYRPVEIEAIERDHDVRRIVIDGGWGRLTSLDVYAAAPSSTSGGGGCSQPERFARQDGAAWRWSRRSPGSRAAFSTEIASLRGIPVLVTEPDVEKIAAPCHYGGREALTP